MTNGDSGRWARRPRGRRFLAIAAAAAAVSTVGPAPEKPRWRPLFAVASSTSSSTTTTPSAGPVATTTPPQDRPSAAVPTSSRPTPRPARPARAVAPPAPADDNVPSPIPPFMPAAALQAGLDRWLASQTAARSVAVAVSLVGDDAAEWSGEAHVGAPLLHSADEYGVLSITKTFTEALVLREVAAGRISLDGPVPPIAGIETDPGDAVVTPRMLLQHTSGLMNYTDAAGYDAARPITPREVVSMVLDSPRLSPPGAQANYSNTNFHWLGLLLEQVTGRSYGDLVADLAASVGLRQTRLDPAGRPGWVGFASGGIRSSVTDLARWGSALFSPGRVLPAAQLTGLTTIGRAGVSLGLWPQCPCTTEADGDRHQVGLRQTVAHGGFFFYPDQRLVVVVHFEPAGAPDVDAAALAATLRDALRSGLTR